MKRQHPTDPNLFWCSRCKQYKALHEIGRRASGELNSYCKQCVIEKVRIWQQNNQDRISKWREENRERINENHRRDYAKHREKRLMSCAEYNSKHPDVHRKASDKYIRINRIEINRKKLERYKQKYETNPQIFKDRERKRRNDLTDDYVKITLKMRGVEISTETVELQRQQLIMKRTLKQFKKWREENESNYKDVHGEQRAYEEDHERGLSAGGGIRSAAGI